MTVVVVGGANLDVLARSRAPLVAGTSNPGTTVATPGGVGRNVAETLAHLGTTTTLLTAVGDDPDGALVVSAARAAGAEVVLAEYDGATDRYTAVLDHDGALMAGVADMSAVTAIDVDDLRPLVATASWLVLDGNLEVALLERALRLAAQHAVPVVLDPVSGPKAARIRDTLGTGPIHTLTPTLDELAALTGETDAARAVGRLHRLGVETVWLRRGAEGSTVFVHGHPPHAIRLGPVEAVDVTGAGDAMLASYVHFLGRGCSILEAAELGAAAALLTVRSPLTVRPDLTEDLIRTTREEHR